MGQARAGPAAKPSPGGVLEERAASAGQVRVQASCAQCLPHSEGEARGPEHRQVVAEDVPGRGRRERRRRQGLRVAPRRVSDRLRRRMRARGNTTARAQPRQLLTAHGQRGAQHTGLARGAEGRARASVFLYAGKCGDLSVPRTLPRSESFSHFGRLCRHNDHGRMCQGVTAHGATPSPVES